MTIRGKSWRASIKSKLGAAVLTDASCEQTASQVTAAAALVAGKILHSLGEPFSIQGNRICSGTSIGISVYGLGSSDAETMLSQADIALYRAKLEARGTYRFFNDAMETQIRARVTVGNELREAIEAEQLFLLYQPQVNVATGDIVGLEALVRWNHPRVASLNRVILFRKLRGTG